MLTLFIDESRDNKVYTLAGWIGRPKPWDRICAHWKTMLRNTKMPDGSPMPAFHASEIMNRNRINPKKKNRFKGWTDAQADYAFTNATDILCKRFSRKELRPIGWSVITPKKPTWMPQENAIWILLFSRLFSMFVTDLKEYKSCKFVFDEKEDVSKIVANYFFEAKQIMMKNMPENRRPNFSTEFADDEVEPSLQMADLLVYEWRKKLSHQSTRSTSWDSKNFYRLRSAYPNAALRYYNEEDVRTFTAGKKSLKKLREMMETIDIYPAQRD